MSVILFSRVSIWFFKYSVFVFSVTQLTFLLCMASTIATSFCLLFNSVQCCLPAWTFRPSGSLTNFNFNVYSFKIFKIMFHDFDKMWANNYLYTCVIYLIFLLFILCLILFFFCGHHWSLCVSKFIELL